MKIFTCSCLFKKAKNIVFYPAIVAMLLLASGFKLTAASTTKHMAAFDVAGRVTSETGEPLIGVSVTEKGTSNGTATDPNGNFKLRVSSADAVLVFKYIGYTGREIPVGSRALINVQLSVDTKSLNEVVVVAYGSQRRSEVTGAITTIRADDVKDQPVTQFTQSIQGKTPGVQVNQTTGVPGQGISIQIRGATSFSGGSQPLYVVDGVPLVSDINSLNPSEIESFTILKDASSTALYGSRAANGVVIITTKHGKPGQTTLNFNAFYGVQTVPQKGRPSMMNAEEFAQYEKDVFTEQDRLNRLNGGTGVAIPSVYQNPSQYAGGGTNWYDILLRNAPIQSYNLAMYTGTEKSTTAVTIGTLNQEGVLVGTGYKRYTARVNSDYKFNDRLSFGINVAPTYELYQNTNISRYTNASSDANIFGGGIIQNAIASSPIAPYKNPDGSLTLVSTSPGLFGNPNWYRVATESVNNSQKGRLLSNAYGAFEIVKGLKFRTSLNIDYVNEQNQRWNPSTTGGLFNPPPINANASTYSDIYYSWLAENTLNYTHSFTGGHNLDVLVGYTAQKYHENYNFESGSGFPNDRISSLAAATLFNNPVYDIQEWSLASLVSRINYNYKNRYLLSASFRRDGSSRFAPNSKYGNFPAVSAGWNVSDENFMSKVPVVSNFKIRASYGLNGNFNIGNYTFIPNTQTSNYVFNNTLSPGTSIANIGNNDLTWEKTKQFDIGTDISVLKDRITFTYDYFNRITDSFLFNVPVPRETGFGSITRNTGKIKFYGHEFSITSRNLTGDFKWTTNFNISFIRNKILNLGPYATNLPRGDANGPNIQQIGQPVGMFYGYKFLGVYMNQADFNNSPKYVGTDGPSQVGTVKYADTNGDGIVDVRDKTIIGNPNPKFTFGMTNTLAYKNFDFSTTFSGSYGNQIENRTLEYIQNLDGVFNVTKDVARRWKSEADPGDGIHPRIVVADAPARTTNSRWVTDGSFLTIKNATLGYTIPVKENKYLTGVRVYASGQQLYVFTKYKGANPEVNAYGTDGLNIGVDYTSYPVPRTISFGVNVNLK